jgi:hypothetical protein
MKSGDGTFSGEDDQGENARRNDFKNGTKGSKEEQSKDRAEVRVDSDDTWSLADVFEQAEMCDEVQRCSDVNLKRWLEDVKQISRPQTPTPTEPAAIRESAAWGEIRAPPSVAGQLERIAEMLEKVASGQATTKSDEKKRRRTEAFPREGTGTEARMN